MKEIIAPMPMVKVRLNFRQWSWGTQITAARLGEGLLGGEKTQKRSVIKIKGPPIDL